MFRRFVLDAEAASNQENDRMRPMGASVHYAGPVPMVSAASPLTCSPVCRSHDIENLYFADGSTFPELPTKNLTFTLMANATRVAETAF